ncbi:MAG: hypothetical protein ACXADB_12020 [Candidatus Hermodarchaeia archaeon]
MAIRLPAKLPWRRKLWRRLVRTWYKRVHGIEIGDWEGTMLPKLGPGQYVSVHRKGQYLEITAHKRFRDIPEGMIRLIPYQPNHGIMVEYHDADGKIIWRTHCDYDMLYKIGAGSQERQANE